MIFHQNADLCRKCGDLELNRFGAAMQALPSALFLLVAAASCSAPLSRAEPIRVRYLQGSSHGYVALKTLTGTILAIGESTQIVQGDRVTSRLSFRFRDGSIDDDLTVFTQHGFFRLISDHHIQKGPSFPKPIDFMINARTGDMTSRTLDGQQTHQHMDLPDDVSNGLPPNLLLNILPSSPETKISYVIGGDKPRLIHLSIKPTGSLPFVVGGMRHKATDFTLHIELGGLTAVIAPVIGKEPQDFHIWIQSGTPPAFVREQGQLYEGGPIWRIEQISATFSP